jgi:hypothetical protein
MTLIYISKLSVQLFGSALCVLMRVIPQRYRFGFAVAIARLFPHGLRHTLSFRMERMPGVSSAREAILSIIIEAMDCRRIRYDPTMTATGIELIHGAVRERQGVLLVGTHANGVLVRAALRLLHDEQAPLTVISLRDQYAVCGTGLTLPAIHPSGSFMIRVRTQLRKAQIVCGLIDTFNRCPKRPLELRAANGSIWGNDSLIRLALACNAKIIFGATHLSRNGSLVVTFKAAAEAQTPEDYWHQLAAFFQQHISVNT